MAMFGRAGGADFGANWSKLLAPYPLTRVAWLFFVYPSMSILFEQKVPAKNFETNWTHMAINV